MDSIIQLNKSDFQTSVDGRPCLIGQYAEGTILSMPDNCLYYLSAFHTG